MNKSSKFKRLTLIFICIVMVVGCIPFSASAANANANTIFEFCIKELKLNTAGACGVLANIEASRISIPIFTATAATATVSASGTLRDLPISKTTATRTATTGRLSRDSFISSSMSLPTTRATQAIYLTSSRMLQTLLRVHTMQAMTGATILSVLQTRPLSPRAEAARL